MAFEWADFKPFLRLVSALTGLAVLALSCAGFQRLAKTKGSIEGQASFGCMCVLGVFFGALLFFGETRWERFFFFFGFMRYRFGRAIIFAIAGVMTTIMGKNMNDQCNCSSFTLVIIVGVVCLACTVLQVLAMLFSGNNTTAANASSQRRPPAPGIETEAKYEPPVATKPAKPAKASKRTKKESSKASSSTEATMLSPVVSVVPPTHHEAADPNMPAWMNA